MLFLHEIHEVLPGRAEALADAYRTGWMPALARGSDARLLWFWEHVHGSSRAHNCITVTAVKDGEALGRLDFSVNEGELAGWMRKVDRLRRDVSTRTYLAAPFYNMQAVDFGEIPSAPEQRRPHALYCEDTVWPWVLDDYIALAGEQWVKGAHSGQTKARARVEIPAFFQSAEGTGNRPELLIVQKIVDPPQVFVRNLVGADYPPEMKQPDHYFVRGLKVRDQWESKVLRTATWSPLG